jgi:hypothetical protein
MLSCCVYYFQIYAYNVMIRSLLAALAAIVLLFLILARAEIILGHGIDLFHAFGQSICQ